ncbi:MAG: sigma-70 family RNA polymerase sigma factor [Candidatus Hydrogenedentes bacterium]|nr:sigma-70 family RNA polymerase sigma factor [Candidatus Hydrogenedentota bacterium]
MPQEDLALLERWTEQRDGEAFSGLVSRYSGVVFGACKRIFGNRPDAEDAAQECFEALAAAGTKPGPYLGAWLHRVATYHALSRLRADERRKRREQAFAEGAERPAEVEWKDIYEYVDEAINELPERFRVPLVRHFLEGQTQEAVGAALGVSRRVVSYRITQGVERLRTSLKRKGIYHLGGLSLAALLEANAAEAAPATLLAKLGKVALVGPGTSAPIAAASAVQKAAASGTSFAVIKIAAAAVAALMLYGAGYAGWKYVPRSQPAPAVTVSNVKAEDTAAPAAAPGQSIPSAAPAASPAPSQAVPGAAAANGASGLVGPSREALEKGHVVKRISREDVEKALETEVALSMRDVHIGEVLSFLQSNFSVNVILDDEVVVPRREDRMDSAPQNDTITLQKAPVYVTDGAITSIGMNDTSLAEILRTVCDPLGLDYVVRGKYIWVSSPALIAAEKLTDSRPSEVSDAMEAVLESHASVHMSDVHLSFLLDFLQSQYDANLVLDYRVVSTWATDGVASYQEAVVDPKSPYVTDGRMPYISLQKVPLRDVIDIASRQLNLAYSVEDGFVWISTLDRIRRRPFQPPDLTQASPALVEALITPMTIESKSESLVEALRVIKQLQPVEFVLDTESVGTLGAKACSVDLKDVPLSTVLSVVLRRYDLDYVAAEQNIIVTSSAKAHGKDVKRGSLTPVPAVASK